MGKSNNKQPKHSINDASYLVLPQRSLPVSRPEPVSLTKLPDVDIPSRPPSPPLSPTEDFYDAVDYLASPPDADGDVFYELYEHMSVRLVIPEPEYDGAAKGRIGKVSSAPNRQATAAAPSTFNFSFSNTPPKPDASSIQRGSKKPAVNLPEGPTTNPMAQEARKAATHDSHLPRKPVKKALIIGINYASWDKDKRLYYAVNDARQWRKTFMDKGVENDNIRYITDEGDMRYAPTYAMLLEQIKWLVRDAKYGDALFFVYSGHAMITKSYGPCIITADRQIFPRPTLEKELVMSIPAGVDLQVVFDCCHSGGMIGLQYCVGRMSRPSDSPANEPTRCAVEPEPTKSGPAPPRQTTSFSHSPQQASLYGIANTGDATSVSVSAGDAVSPPPPAAAPAPAPVTPDRTDSDTFGAAVPHRLPRGGVVAAPPLKAAAAAGPQPEGAAAGAVRFIGSFLGLGSSSAPAPAPTPAPPPVVSEPPVRSGPRRACQGVVEGIRMPDYFEERKEGFVEPAGKVMVWAGTGESQKAFESYGGVRQGVVTKAMCAAFERITTRRDLWSYLVQEIENENDKRSARDAGKSASQRPLASLRIQHAELWVSQAHLTQPVPAPVLDQPIL